MNRFLDKIKMLNTGQIELQLHCIVMCFGNPGLNDEEYIQLLDAMKKHEGWREGREEYIPTKMKKVLGVHMKRHVITEFLIGDMTESAWITKKEAIALAEAGKLIATVVHTKGEPYLRPKTHQQSFREMVIT